MEYASLGVISKYTILERVAFVDEFDKTSVGKTDKKLLRHKYQHSE